LSAKLEAGLSRVLRQASGPIACRAGADTLLRKMGETPTPEKAWEVIDSLVDRKRKGEVLTEYDGVGRPSPWRLTRVTPL